MAGAPWGHVRLTARLVTLLNIQLKGCRAVSSDLRVRIGTRYAYPDVVVVCGEPRLTDELPEPAQSNASRRGDVRSTVAIDKGYKFSAYHEIGSLVEYWIIDYEDRRALQCIKSQVGWDVRIHGEKSTLRSQRLGVEIFLDDVFAI